jgi:hypothetical protein
MANDIIPDIKKGNIGTQLKCTMTKPDPNGSGRIAVDISSNNTIKIELESPRGKKTLLNATLTNTGTDGKMSHTDSTGVFDRTGRWRVRGVVTFNSGFKFQGTWTGFFVGE